MFVSFYFKKWYKKTICTKNIHNFTLFYYQKWNRFSILAKNITYFGTNSGSKNKD